MKQINYAAALFVLTLAGCGLGYENPFPNAADIDRVELQRVSGSTVGPREIKNEKWQEITKAMLPAYRDPVPAKWVMYGDIHITLKSGSQVNVWPMVGPNGKAAFAIGESAENKTYYIGGSNSQLRPLMNEVRE